MRIVRPTEPPSMAVVVDTIVAGEVELSLTPADLHRSRIDIVFAKEGMVGVLNGAGVLTGHIPAPPALATGLRELARVHVSRGQGVIGWASIVETP